MPDIFVDDNTGDEFVDDAIEAYASKQPVSMPSDAGTMMNRPMAQMTPERRLIEALGFKYPEIERAKGYRPGEIMAGATRGPEYGMEYSSNPILRTGGEIVRGATAPGRKAEQFLAYLKNKTGLSSPEQYQLDKARMAAEEAAYQSKGSAQIPFLNQSLAEMLGGAGSVPNLSPSALPSKILTEQGIRQTGSALGKQALAGGVYGQLQPVENRSEDDFLSQNFQQGMMGSMASPGIQVFGEKALAPFARGVGRMAGKSTGKSVAAKDISEALASKSMDLSRDLADLKNISSLGLPGFGERAKELASQAKSGMNRSERVRFSAQVQELKEKADVAQLYAERNKLADEIGAKVDKKKIGDALRDSIAMAEDALDDQTAAYLRKMKDRLDSGDIKNDFVSMDKFRSVIGDELRSHYAGKSTVTGSKGVSALQPVKKAITAAMDDSASIYGKGLQDITVGARQAKKAYQNKWQDPLAVQVHGKLPVQAGSAQYGDTPTDELVGKFGYQGEAHGQELGEKAEKALGLFTGSGKSSVQSILFDAAKAKAKGDPTVFLAEMDQPGVRKFFSGEEREALEGLKKIMRASETLGKVTAGSAGAYLGHQFGSMFGHETIGGLGGLSMGYAGENVRGVQMPIKLLKSAWSQLLQTGPGQRLLLDAARAGEADMPAILQQLPKILTSSELAPKGENKLQELLRGQKP